MPLQGNKEEFVVHPRKLKIRDCNILECFYVLTKYNQYNWINPRGKLFFFHMFSLFFILNKLCCLCQYFIDLCAPTAETLGLLCGLFQFNHKLAGTKKSQDDDQAFNSYDFHLYGLCCAVAHNVQKAKCMNDKGYIRAPLFCVIFYIVTSDYANDDSVKVPGTVLTT